VASPLDMSPQSWTSTDVDLLVENLELGIELEIIASLLQRTPSSVAMKVVHLASTGRLVIMAPGTFDALVKGSW